ncbi:hypothetical protein GJAV_G00060100 [Gymnothorax javanicus]|nr:hypothetical protein GJAV_G00060100 [Gymnothorax javanicus]
MNNEFKESLKNSRGNSTDAQVDRSAQMPGSLRKEIDRLHLTQWLSSSSTHKKRVAYDIAKFMVEYKNDGLFSYTPGPSGLHPSRF